MNMRNVVPTFLAVLAAALSAWAQQVSLVNGVRALITGHDFAAAERLARAYQARNGPTPELAAALSWLARAALESHNYDQADALANETAKTVSRFTMGQKLDDDPWL